VATFVAGSVLAIAAPTFAVFLVARAIQAVGAGGIFPVAAAAIADRVPLERRGSALGLLGAVWGLAAIVGPTFGGVVTHFVSWRWIFAANVPLGLIVIVRSRSHVPAAAARTRGPLDVAGLALLAFGLLAVMIGLTRLDAAAPTLGGNALTLAAVAVALIAFAALIPVERAAREPVISLALFGTRQLVVTYTLEVLIGIVCTENPIRIDWRRESPNVSAQ
jgi:MFS family permease